MKKLIIICLLLQACDVQIDTESLDEVSVSCGFESSGFNEYYLSCREGYLIAWDPELVWGMPPVAYRVFYTIDSEFHEIHTEDTSAFIPESDRNIQIYIEAYDWLGNSRFIYQ